MRLTSKASIFALIFVSSLLFSCEKHNGEEGPDTIVIPEAVDLGLSVKWASFDVGATKPGEVGYFVSWGEITPKSVNYKWANYLWCSGTKNRLTKYNYDAAYGNILDYRVALKTEDDIAHALYGGDWRVPTTDEVKELIESPFLTFSEEKIGYTKCLRVSSTRTGNSILFPAGGCCAETIQPLPTANPFGYFWSAEIEYTTNPLLYHPDPTRASYLLVSPVIEPSTTSLALNTFDRAFGMNVRAVSSGGIISASP